MMIRSMTATFGKLEQQTLSFQPGLNVIHAPNEWGKSTWCAFLVAMLYGIETRSHSTKTTLADKERFAPWSGSPMEGRLELVWEGKNITIERSSRGRTPLGVFRAYETDTGLTIPELTAANCGQTLLGVEKSVFLRSGFIQLADLPVAQDEVLQRRLNALVTTGEEGGAAETLAQQLRELKNRCRANRSTGLLPQAQIRCRELETSLAELLSLREQAKKIRQRQSQLEAHRDALENHRVALEYQRSRTFDKNFLEAKQAKDAAAEALAQQQALCACLPQSDTVEKNLLRLEQLRDMRDALLLEQQLLTPVENTWQPHSAFQNVSPESAPAQATRDRNLYSKKQPIPWYWLLLTLLGAGGFGLSHWAGPALGAVIAALGIILFLTALTRQKQTRKQLAAKYAPLSPEQWIAAAEEYRDHARRMQAHSEKYKQERLRISEELNLLSQQIQELSQTDWDAARRDYDRLSQVSREYHRSAELVRTLESAHREVPCPAFPDEMTYSPQATARLLSDTTMELRQLQLKLGTILGRMETLDTEEALRKKILDAQARVTALENTCAALELAQDTLAQAAAELQRRFAPALTHRAQALFSRLTGERYDRLTLSEDLSLLAGAQSEATLRSPLWRSSGTSDQLYLALRLALSETLTPDAPLVLDDALVRFDDERLQLTMAVLQEIAQSKQILLFSCQTREKQLLFQSN